MHAMVLNRLGGPLEWTERPAPCPVPAKSD